MIVEKKTTVTFRLTMDIVEAKWLKCIVQNPIGGIDIEDENEPDQNMRQNFWDALHKSGV